MKITFICGSLEPGKDGVGDYVLRLSEELTLSGHNVSVLALFDKFVEKDLEGVHNCSKGSIPYLRVSHKTDYTEHFDTVNRWIVNEKPDWLSLQFVPFSFDSKGLPFKLGKLLKTLIGNFNWHIMFHELWVGLYGNEKQIKKRVLGYLQKVLIKKLINSLKPRCITTTIPTYKNALSNYQVNILPLFGNIPIQPNVKCLDEDDTKFKVIHFGSFTTHFLQLEQQLTYLKNLSNWLNKEIKFIVMGKGGNLKDKAMAKIRDYFKDAEILDLGTLPIHDVSSALQCADLGISKADLPMLGKSGSTIAMLEHGLPVLLRGNFNNNKELFINANNNQLLFCDSPLSNVPRKKKISNNGLPEVSASFLNFLNH